MPKKKRKNGKKYQGKKKNLKKIKKNFKNPEKILDKLFSGGYNVGTIIKKGSFRAKLSKDSDAKLQGP